MQELKQIELEELLEEEGTPTRLTFEQTRNLIEEKGFSMSEFIRDFGSKPKYNTNTVYEYLNL